MGGEREQDKGSTFKSSLYLHMHSRYLRVVNILEDGMDNLEMEEDN